MSTDTTAVETPLVKVSHLKKSFGHVIAVHDISFEIGRGEVLAVVGDNGAGKSTLMGMLSGNLDPDEGGVIEIDGKPVRFKGPRDATAAGIATVYQNLALVDSRDVAANLFLGQEPRRGPFVNRREMNRRAEEALSQLTFRLPSVKVPVSLLSGGQRQAVAIARVLLHGSNLVIMDEPTAALGVQESARVLDLIRGLRDKGTSVLLVSHNLEHVWSIADRVMALRLGRVAGIRNTSDTTVDEIVKLIVYGAGA